MKLVKEENHFPNLSTKYFIMFYYKKIAKFIINKENLNLNIFINYFNQKPLWWILIIDNLMVNSNNPLCASVVILTTTCLFLVA